MKLILVWSLIVVALLTGALDASAFGVRPIGTTSEDEIITFEAPLIYKWTDRSFRNVTMAMFTNPVHERATNLVYGCEETVKTRGACATPRETYAPAAVLAGSQWNDNPPFKLSASTTDYCKPYIGKTIRAPYAQLCWYTLFRDAAKMSAKGEYFDAASGKVLLYRVHFGDMQFLHAMAAKDDEKAADTKKKIMMWAEFTYKIATGAFPRSVPLTETGIDGMKELFVDKGLTAQQLFIRGRSYYEEKDFRNFAFGSLLHMVQDSFTSSHTQRNDPTGGTCNGPLEHTAPGKVSAFLSYANQEAKEHAKRDTQDALTVDMSNTPPTAVEVGKTLKGFYEQGKAWEEVRPYLDCVFDVENAEAKSGPGEFVKVAEK